MFYTRFKRKQVLLACVIGKSPRHGIRKLVGNAQLAAGVLEKGAEVVTAVAMTSHWEVPLRMRDALASAAANEAVLFICKDEALYEQACTLLNAQFTREDLKHLSWQEP